MDASAAPSFGVLLRRYRRAAGLSQAQLAARAGLSAQAVSLLERGIRHAPYRDTIRVLAQALGLGTEEQDRLTASVARARHAAEAPVALPATESGTRSMSTSSFVGREVEQTTVRRLLAASRLLTLTGTGGVGKTRLATHVAFGLTERYPDGVVLVELAPVSDPALVPQTVAATIGLREAPNRPPLDTLVEALQDKHALLLLDNCEHLRAGAAELATALLRACPTVGILATSREMLGVIGETVWWVPSMAVPQAGEAEPGTIGGGPSLLPHRVDAVRLFCDRATTVRPAFALTEANEAAVAAICRRLDGIPLAIELAAARARILTPQQIAARLDARFRLLTGGDRAAPSRQQTLRATMDWSYDLLTQPERRLLERLSTFVGGCGIEAAEAVCVGGLISSESLFDLLTSLADKSLLTVDYADGGARYRLLETVREYAREKLAETGTEEAIRQRWCAWGIDLATRMARHLRSPEQGAWLDRLERDHDNLGAMLQWMAERGDDTLGLRLAGVLAGYWHARGHLREGRRWLEESLQRAVAAPLALRADALHGLARVAQAQGDFPRARVAYEQCLTLRRTLGDRHGAAVALSGLAGVARDMSEQEEARSRWAASLRLFRELGDQAWVARDLNNLAIVADDFGEYEQAVALFEESLTIHRARTEQADIARVLHNLVHPLLKLGAHERALASCAEALALRRALGDRRGVARTIAY